MSDPNAPLGYSSAVDSYWSAGFRGILPLKHAHKGGKNSGLPTGYTGREGVEPSWADLQAWSEVWTNGNLCLRLPHGVIGIDIDAYGAKTGAAAFVKAVELWGPLPVGPRSSSRDGDLTSGIRLFRVPEGVEFETVINFPDLGVGDIEIVQHHHRYVVCWPSIHPEGRQYRWRDAYDNDIGVPLLAELPWLPPPWIEGLKARPRVDISDGAIAYDVKLALTEGWPSIAVAQRLQQAIKELNISGASRHDTCTRHVMALARMGKNGESGVRHAMSTLREVLVALRKTDESDTPEGTRDEFIGMLTGKTLARELSKPGITDWVNALILDSPPAPEGQRPYESPPPAPDSDPTQSAAPATESAGAAEPNAGAIAHPTRQPTDLEYVERGFWQSRESLAQIYQTSMARMCSPWAVLGHCAARALTGVRPHVVLPPLIGGRGSLNFFAAIVAASGGGKGASAACARELLPGDLEVRNVGSGEGIIAMFGRPNDDGDPTPAHEALMFNADEVDTLAALNARSASTTLSILRSGFSGETLGFSYAAKEKRRHIGAHTYRMTMVVSIQPTRAGWLLADEGGGTPQRFMWFPGTDARVSRQRPWPTGPLTLPQPGEWLYPREIVLPQEAVDTLVDEHVKRQQGDATAMDGHALFCREKFAYALAVLDGRVQMTLEDWELSGVAANVSLYTRQLTVDAVKEAAERDAVERGDLRGLEIEAADVAKIEAQVKRAQRVLNWLLHRLEKIGSAGASRSELIRACAYRDRPTLSTLLDNGHETIRAEMRDGGVWWFRK